jgi:Ni/Co efflux regulator RcnB
MQNMNKLLIALLVYVSSMASSYAAESKDDAATLGTSKSPQVDRQQRRTDKGPIGGYQDSVNHDASNLGNAESPQVKDQSQRTDKGSADRPFKRYKNKVLRNKDEKAGTTLGNPVQPTEPEAAPAATSN